MLHKLFTRSYPILRILVANQREILALAEDEQEVGDVDTGSGKDWKSNDQNPA